MPKGRMAFPFLYPVHSINTWFFFSFSFHRSGKTYRFGKNGFNKDDTHVAYFHWKNNKVFTHKKKKKWGNVYSENVIYEIHFSTSPR